MCHKGNLGLIPVIRTRTLKIYNGHGQIFTLTLRHKCKKSKILKFYMLFTLIIIKKVKSLLSKKKKLSMFKPRVYNEIWNFLIYNNSGKVGRSPPPQPTTHLTQPTLKSLIYCINFFICF